MEDFAKLFGGLLAFVYHCFDRIVILRSLAAADPTGKHRALLPRRARRRSHHQGGPARSGPPSTINGWKAFARNHQIPIEWAEKGVRKEDYVRPCLRRMERQHRYGVYFILKSMEIGHQLPLAMPKYPTADPNYRILSRQRSRYTHYYFYIRDPVLGPDRVVRRLVPAVLDHLLPQRPPLHRTATAPRGRGSFAKTTMPSCGWRTPKHSKRPPTRSAPSSFAPGWITGPGRRARSSPRRTARRSTSAATTHCNKSSTAATLIFRRNFPIHKLFERSCDLGLLRLSADRIAQIFGWRLHKRLPGKLSSVLEKHRTRPSRATRLLPRTR